MPRLESYSGLFRTRARRLLRPSTLEELTAIVHQHDSRGRKLTLRGGGHSFHNQALGRGSVLSLDRLPHALTVVVDDAVGREPDGSIMRWNTVEATAWTPWDAVVRATLRLGAPERWHGGTASGVWEVERYASAPASGRPDNVALWQCGSSPARALPTLLPYTLVSSGRITPAGSLSGDGVWRLSSALGRESDNLVWLDVLRSDGRVLRVFNSRFRLWEQRALHPGPDTASDADENARWFAAIVGGFGLLGVVVRVKYLLLELDASVRAEDFPSIAAGRPTSSTDDERGFEWRRGLARLRRAADDILTSTLRPRWPSYPHSPAAELGQLGQALPVQALTWMRESDGALQLADELARGFWEQQRTHASLPGIALPRITSARTYGHFGLVFPNGRGPFKTVLGQLAYGSPPAGALPFALWDRAYSWKNTTRILRWHALPWAARAGEKLVYEQVFRPCIERGPTANAIPECTFFWEGHGVALSDRIQKPHTMQQAWTIPFELDTAGRLTRGRELLAEFLGALVAQSREPLWLGNAVRFQVCDVKCVPASTGFLSSSRESPSFMITVTVENTRGYSWLWGGFGSPARAFRSLSERFAPRGVKVHLTKNVFVDTRTLRRMYGAGLSELLAVKRALDPGGTWTSDFMKLLF